jgi:hypothetical protein
MEADPLSRRPDFVPQATVPLLWDGEVSSYRELRRKFQPLLEDAQLNLLIVNALRLSHELDDLIREGYSQDSFQGDEGEWTRVSGRKTLGYKPKLGALASQSPLYTADL